MQTASNITSIQSIHVLRICHRLEVRKWKAEQLKKYLQGKDSNAKQVTSTWLKNAELIPKRFSQGKTFLKKGISPVQESKAGVRKSMQQVLLEQEGLVAVPPSTADYLTIKARRLVCSKVAPQANWPSRAFLATTGVTCRWESMGKQNTRRCWVIEVYSLPHNSTWNTLPNLPPTAPLLNLNQSIWT